MASYDDYVLRRDKRPDVPMMRAKDVQYEYIQAMSTISQNNMCTISTAPLASNDQWYDYSSAILQVPVIINTPASAGISEPLSVGLKPAGCISLIDRLQININGRNMVASSPKNPVFQHLINIFSMSGNFLKLVGPQLLMGEEMPIDELRAFSEIISNTISVPASSAHRCNSVTPFGDQCPVTATATAPTGALRGTGGYNKALYSRCLSLAFPNSSAGTPATTMSVQGRNVYTDSLTSTGGTGASYSMTVPVPLRYLSDFFRQCGLLKNVNGLFSFYVNNCTGMSAGFATGAGKGSGCGPILGTTANNYCPIMISERYATGGGVADFGLPYWSGVAPGGAANTANTLSIANPQYGTADGSRLVSVLIGTTSPVTLWLPRVSPRAVDLVEMDAKSKTFRFRDYQYCELVNGGIGPTTSINWTVSAGIVAPKKVYILGYASGVAGTAGTSGNVTARVAAEQTVTYEPHYSSPCFSLTNIQMAINSTPLYTQQIDYEFRTFEQQLRPLYGLSASQDERLTTGLYGRSAWDIAKIYVFDVSRNVVSDAPSSLILRAQNASLYSSIDLAAYVEQEIQVTMSFSPNSSTTSPIEYV